MVFISRFPEVPAPCSWIVGSQAFWFFSASLGDREGHIFPRSLCFLGTLLCCLYLNQALLHFPRIPGIPKYPSPIIFPRSPTIFLTFEGWVGIFLSFIPWGWKPTHLWARAFPYGPLTGMGLSLFPYWMPEHLMILVLCVVLGFRTTLWFFGPQEGLC